MHRLALLLMLLVAVVLLGCDNSKATRANRPKTYTSIVSLSPGTTELIAAQGDISALKGRTQADNWPATTVSRVPVVASVKPDYEKIAEIKPDLVIYDAALMSPEDVDKIKQLSGADTFSVAANSIEDFIKELYSLGSLIAQETRLNEYALRIVAERDKASATAPATAPKVAIIMPSDTGSDYIAGVDSFVADAVRAAGGEPVGPSADKFVPLGGEALASFNPDIIVVPGTKGDVEGALSVARNPAYASTKAIQNKKISAIDQDILLRRGARVDKLIEGLNKVVVRSTQ